MRNAMTAIGVICALAGAVRAQETAKQKDIRHLLKITGSGELGAQVMTQMMGNMKRSMPNVPERSGTTS